jgi:hypothetical protein
MTQTVDRVANWAEQYISDEELAMQDAEALRTAGDELAEAVEAIVNGTGDNWHPALREPLVIALCRWREATS